MSKTGVVSRGREKERRGKARDRNGEGGPAANLIFVREPIHVAKVTTIWNSPGSSSNRALLVRPKRSEWSLPTEIVSRKLARIFPSKLLGPSHSPSLSFPSSWNFQRRRSRRSIRDVRRNKSKGGNIKAGYVLCVRPTHPRVISRGA